ncbi:multidrug effflux MFS transporter [Roseateles chitinivorans]|uniref:multidrug effflux MFS transporter n=1 Tax=Roseateles chitinivorans TaxID=2917965 RepID=UPI003D66F7E7
MSVPSPADVDRGARPAPALQVVALAMLLGLQPVTTDLYLPALPGLRADLHAGMGATQLTLSVLMLAFGLSQLLLGPLADRFGRRPVLLGGLSLYVAAAIGAALAATIEGLVACRALQGLGLAASVVVARAMLRDWFEPQEGARMMAKALSGLGVIALASPLIGGVLAAGLGWRWAILATAVAGAATLAMIALRIPESLPRPDPAALRPSGLVANWRTVLSNPTFRAYALLTALAYATLYAFLAGSSFVFIEVLGLGHHAYGALVAGGAALYVTGTLICRRWLRTLSVADTAARGAGFTALGALGMGLAAFVLPPSPWALMIPHVGIMLGHGVLQPCGQAGAVGPFPRQAGAAAALSGFAIALVAFAVGAWLSASLDGTVTPLAATMMVLGLCTATCAWTLVRRHGQPQRRSA